MSSGHSRPGFVPATSSEPPIRGGRKEEGVDGGADDDEDLRAAIEASLREMRDAPSAPAAGGAEEDVVSSHSHPHFYRRLLTLSLSTSTRRSSTRGRRMRSSPSPRRSSRPRETASPTSDGTQTRMSSMQTPMASEAKLARAYTTRSGKSVGRHLHLAQWGDAVTLCC